MAHWHKILGDETVAANTILSGDQVAGNIVSRDQEGKREVGYWIGRKYWGKGVATITVSEFLHLERVRPLYAYVATQNVGSVRV